MSIPQTIHQIWIGSSLPTRFMDNMAAWQDLNKGWRYQLWTEPPASLYNLEMYWDAPLYVKPDAVWQFRADLMRYEILYREGGFYADCDTKPLRPLGDLLDGKSEFAVREDENFCGNTYLAAEPGNLVFHELMTEQLEHAQGYSNAAAGVVTGPQYMTPFWRAHDCYVDERTGLWFPYSWEDVRRSRDKRIAIPEDAYAVHEWDHSRQKKKQWAKQTRENLK